MALLLRRLLVLFLCAAIVLPTNGGSATGQKTAAFRSEQRGSLRDYLQKSYLELFELAPTLAFSRGEIEAQRNALKKG